MACSTTRRNAGTGADHLGAGPHQFAQALVLAAQCGLLQRVLQRQQNFVAAERLFQKIERAGARGGHGFGDGAVPGNHDGGREVFALPQIAQEFDAAAVGEADIQQQQIGSLSCGLGIGDGSRERDRVAFALQNQAQRAADIRLVVQHEDTFGGHGQLSPLEISPGVETSLGSACATAGLGRYRILVWRPIAGARSHFYADALGHHPDTMESGFMSIGGRIAEQILAVDLFADHR